MYRKNPQNRFLRSCKAQDGTSASALVALIALLIVFYLLFVPPAFRDEILEGESGSGLAGDSDDTNFGNALLRATPGTLSPISSEEIEHSIPTITLVSKSEAKVLESVPQVYTKTSVFGKSPIVMEFMVNDVENTENVMLSFISEKRKGDLIIVINGNEIFRGEVSTNNPTPIKINSRYIVSGTNTIEFFAGSVGAAFWRVNKHVLENVQVSASIKDLSGQQSSNVFVVSTTEKSNLQRAILRFSPGCTSNDAGILNILINSHSIFYAIPDCGGRVGIEFSPDVLREGENTINFISEKGSYIIELIRINSELKDVIQPAYYFDISSKDMSNIRDGLTSAKLKIVFVDDTDQKSGIININGRETNLHQNERVYEKNLNDYVVEGSNAIKITPNNEMQVVSLEVLI